MANKSFTRTLSKGLIGYLKSKMPSIVEAYDEFPNPSQKLKFPSFSLFLQKPNFTPETPYTVYVGDVILTGPDINKAIVRRCVGKYDLTIQLDFWCESKFQRHDIYEEFIQAITQANPSSGLSFKLEDYFNEWTHIDVNNVSFSEDSEISSQRNEWRFIVTISGNARCIRESLEYVMVNVESNVNTTP